MVNIEFYDFRGELGYEKDHFHFDTEFKVIRSSDVDNSTSNTSSSLSNFKRGLILTYKPGHLCIIIILEIKIKNTFQPLSLICRTPMIWYVNDHYFNPPPMP